MGAMVAALSELSSSGIVFYTCANCFHAAVRTKARALPLLLGQVVPAPLASALDRAAGALADALAVARGLLLQQPRGRIELALVVSSALVP